MTAPQSAAARLKIALLQHLRRYCISTPEVLKRLIFTGTDARSYNNVVYRGLARGGLIESRQLPGHAGSAVYFQLTALGARDVEAPPEWAKQLPVAKVIELYAELLFCCHPSEPRPKLTREEFNHWFPDRLGDRQLGGAYYIDVQGDVRRLGRIIVDLNRNLPNARDTARTQLLSLGQDFLAERRVAIVVVTANAGAERDARACMRPLATEGVRILTRNFKRELSPMLSALAKTASAGRASVGPQP